MTDANPENHDPFSDIARSAFRSPGIVPWLMQLEQIARDAIAEHGHNMEAAAEDVIIAVRGNTALMWALFAPYQDRAVGDLLHRVRAGRAMPRPGQGEDDPRGEFARSGQTETAADPAAASRPGQDVIASHGGGARPATDREAAASLASEPTPPVPPSRGPTLATIRAGLAGAAPAVIQSILDTHRTELGKPVGDCTKAELEGLSRRHRGYARFYDGLAAPMPPQGVVREFHRPEEADVLWRGRWEGDVDE